MSFALKILILTCLSVFHLSFCQTFHYSHGWVNGKRGMHAVGDYNGDVVASGGGSGRTSSIVNDGSVIVLTQCQLDRLRDVLLGKLPSQVPQIPCEQSNINEVNDNVIRSTDDIRQNFIRQVLQPTNTDLMF